MFGSLSGNKSPYNSSACLTRRDDSSHGTAESTPMAKSPYIIVASPQLLRNAFDGHMRSEGHSVFSNEALIIN